MLGDVILLRGTGKSAPVNLAAQRLVTGRLWGGDGYTHVAFASGPWQVIHAMPAPRHVEIAAIQELLAPETTAWRIWRNAQFSKRLDDEPGLADRLHYGLSLSLGEAYNSSFVLKNDLNESFCSQLVGKLARQWGMPFAKPPHQLMPLDIAAEVEKSSAWIDVTEEYRKRLATDPDHRRLFFNDNHRDSQAHLAAYIRAKESANAYLRAFTVMVQGVGPESRVELVEESGMRRISVPASAAGQGMHGRPLSELPDPYHGSECDWDRYLNPAAQSLSDAQYAELMALELPGAPDAATAEAPWNGVGARHDAALVLGREDIAKTAALIFDGIIPMGIDRVPAGVVAWGARDAWRVDPSQFHRAMRQRTGAGERSSLRVRTPDGEAHVFRPDDVDGEAHAFSSVLERGYVDNERQLQERVLLGLQDAGLSGSAWVAPSELVERPGQEASAFILEIVGAVHVDVEALSWEDIVRLRTDLATMHGLRALRHLFVPASSADAAVPRDEAVSRALALFSAAARGQDAAVIAGTFGIVLAAEERARHPAWRLVKAAVPFPSDLPAEGTSFSVGGTRLRLRPASDSWAALAAKQGAVFVVGGTRPMERSSD